MPETRACLIMFKLNYSVTHSRKVCSVTFEEVVSLFDGVDPKSKQDVEDVGDLKCFLEKETP